MQCTSRKVVCGAPPDKTVLLYVLSSDKQLVDKARQLGVAAIALPSARKLIADTEDFWLEVSRFELFLWTKEAASLLRRAPAVSRRMLQQCRRVVPVDSEESELLEHLTVMSSDGIRLLEILEGADGTLSIDGSQSPRYGGLNIIPQPSNLHKQELDDEDLSDCMKAVMAAQSLSVLFEAQIHSQLSLADVEALYLPQEYKVPNTHVLRSRLAVAEELSRMYGWQVSGEGATQPLVDDASLTKEQKWQLLFDRNWRNLAPSSQTKWLVYLRKWKKWIDDHPEAA
ncbi:hypothetical protein WJX77_006210 [Trebouxia sp. C0004]